MVLQLAQLHHQAPALLQQRQTRARRQKDFGGEDQFQGESGGGRRSRPQAHPSLPLGLRRRHYA
eukprot:7976385-Alexandrium_andersonii.AAC.1